MVPERLSPAQARRIALAAQGFADRAPAGNPTMAHLKRVVGRTGLLQMDSVNIAARAHFMPLYSRLGPYDPELLHRAAWQPGRRPHLLVEYWAHEAALIPVDHWPLFRWRMEEYADGRYRHSREIMRRNRSLAADVRGVIEALGASTPRDIERELGIEREPGTAGSWWQRGEIKHLCEAMFAAGDLSAVRNGNFLRHYDLTERVVGEQIAARRPDRAAAQRELVAQASRSLGVATIADLADYYRIKTGDARVAVADLLDSGELHQVSIDGWRDPAYLAGGAAIPRRVERSAILSPFDPLVFFRPRAERIFDFRYRIEIYVPEHKRVHGYYVLPYLLGTDIAARVDLKADRKNGRLLVLGAFCEPGHSHGAVAERLAADLRTFAGWLGLGSVAVGERGDLAGELARVMGC
ncbi:YcaQ family DNA glycosylase [Gordonia sp. zg691]|uniref:winged helix-turn-helix domain-containing protein n=1 Tax=Gordonia jinghuaiqii TaxID=2758710 RepID=UPI00166244F8|nr:crosslink repair DNA glycosylase YcaQ family protein [Gordonia jinghuaiqii]MBD0861338.1 YcaQ family DNA glycosylase [Gordonia jinghuaiqii]